MDKNDGNQCSDTSRSVRWKYGERTLPTWVSSQSVVSRTDETTVGNYGSQMITRLRMSRRGSKKSEKAAPTGSNARARGKVTCRRVGWRGCSPEVDADRWSQGSAAQT